MFVSMLLVSGKAFRSRLRLGQAEEEEIRDGTDLSRVHLLQGDGLKY